MGLRVCVGGCASRNRAAEEMETFKIRKISMFIIFLPRGVKNVTKLAKLSPKLLYSRK